MNFDIIQRNFTRGLWSAAMVRLAVKKGIITAEEFTAITHQEYKA